MITANISHQGRHYILLEFECRVGESFNVALVSVTSGNQITDTGLNRLLAKLAIEKGVWTKVVHLFSDISVITMKHTWSTEDQFAKTIQSKIIK